ncbi:TIGR02757 family protein [Panacibacter ginsenosidivorans]|uniref:TIGR02757 family protein n=1 Tax=Panacibacter ginsenosidivorans TaxID=1813871 RepID=A0A5B8V997_9BACT|nr:TIGR02757 family protein [Panacibacter ginsenosidivorans]QEC67994.1 TIGR02757 family protein [Panacibacter ginsenosidivorans]
MKEKNELKDFLDSKVELYNQRGFIKDDPVCIPHLFTKKQDIEIAGFFAAIFAWGGRKTIINKSTELMQLMDMQPHQFVVGHNDKELKSLLQFKHRTFNPTDLLYFIEFLKFHYTKNDSLETAFSKWISPKDDTIEKSLVGFHHYFFSLEDVPARTKKHIATPEKGSNCKRLNMFLRWMVRKDNKGVDFGIWNKIKPSQLICPVDLHVARVAKKLNLLIRKQTDWPAALELTTYLRTLDPSDPVKYDFALFGLGVIEKYY